MLFSVPSRFLNVVTAALAERKTSPRAKREGRAGYQDRSSSPGDAWGRSSHDRQGSARSTNRASGPYGSATYRGGNASSREVPFGKAPVRWSDRAEPARMPEPEHESQDAPHYALGARVKHAKFGTGTIAELTGAGRDTKVRIDFDDDTVGRKTLVLAQAKLERGLE